MEKEALKYPIGDQSFSSVREGGFVYVDKSMYIEKLMKSSKYYFLSRPRRFGKSLFVSMLKCFFEGRRELFKGLYIDTIDWEWEPWPVFYLDLNINKYSSFSDLDTVLESFINTLETEYGIVPKQSDHPIRLANLLRRAYEKTGKRVVILVDEYDKPLVNNINDRETFEAYRDKLTSLYANFKSSADYIQMVFLTGVSRFGKLSIFSALNNIRDISFEDEFAAICGITSDELTAYFNDGIKALSQKDLLTYDEELHKLKNWYDGYHFTPECPDIFNPYSILNAMAKKRYGNYWIESGTPTLLAEQLKKKQANLEELINSRCSENELTGLDIDDLRLKALFYQAGYLTIKDYNPRWDIYTLGLPNEEVTEGFYEFLLPYYANLGSEAPKMLLGEFIHDITTGNVESFVKRLNAFLSGISYEMGLDCEKNVQTALFVLFKLLGMDTDVEYRTSDGRIDILIQTKDYIYIIELKYDESAQVAMEQIKSKEYALPWSTDHRKIYGIGLNYSKTKRRLTESIIERL